MATVSRPVKVITAMKTSSSRIDSVGVLPTKEPTPSIVVRMAKAVIAVAATVTPRGPARKAAHSSSGR